MQIILILLGILQSRKDMLVHKGLCACVGFMSGEVLVAGQRIMAVAPVRSFENQPQLQFRLASGQG